MTLQEATKHIARQLKPLYEDGEVATMTDWVLEFVTMKEKKEKVLSRSATLTLAQIEEINAIVNRLLKNEPLQYVLEESWFSGMKFFINKTVLIPRPETEELVEWAVSEMAGKQSRILEIGTGSGCIAISLKKKLPLAGVWALDISSNAIDVAKKNAALLKTEIHFNEMDFLVTRNWQRLPVFDVIISNPPYVTVSEKANMRMNVLEHEPYIALFVPEDDPLVFYKAIAEFGKSHLKSSGAIYCEINESLGDETADVFRSAGYTCEIRKDMQQKKRMLKALFCP